jgi:MYXO-CTERM domain-containing protein
MVGAWPRYAAAAGSALALANSAEAAIIYSGVRDITASIASGTRTSATEFIDINGKGNGFVLFAQDFVCNNCRPPFERWEVGLIPGNSGGRQILAAGAGADSVRRLVSGALISSGASYFGIPYDVRRREVILNKPPSTYTRGDWPDASNTGFAGIRFTEGGQPHYGWIRLKFSEQAGFPDSITAIDWAYNDVAGAPIRAGQTSSVPEPGGKALALLAAGSVGLLAWRRRKHALSAEDKS